MSKSDLLPCPFCAGKAEILDCSTKTLETITIACECGASMSGYAVLENDIIAAWDTRVKTKAELNAELLAALIQMENWASLYRAEIRRLCGQEPGPLELASQEIREARAVIAKAKEQSNA